MRTLLLALLFIGCTSTQQGTVEESQRFIRASLPFTVEGVSYVGTAVVQRKVSQKVTITVPPNTQKLIVRTCHREEVFDKLNEGAWSYTYVPAQFLENWGECRFRIQLINENANTKQLMIEFTSNELLVGRSQCNGKAGIDSTVSFCQSREGLVQRISFLEKVTWAEGTGCALLKGDGYSFEYSLSKGSCVYAFMNSKSEFHRLVTYGYATIEGN